MKDFSIDIDIAAPPERVWQVISAVERWPEWTASVSSVAKITPGPLAMGSVARVKQPKLRAAVWTVTELEPAKGFTWTSRTMGLLVTGKHWIVRTDHGTRATLSVHFHGLLAGLIGRMGGDITRRYLKLEATGLKRESEKP